MSRLHTLRAGLADVAAQFGVEPAPDLAIPDETVEGNPGIVVMEINGRRRLTSPTWGFPRVTDEMRRRGEPPGRVGMIADLTNPMWDSLVRDPRYRCLIPITHFANPDGVPGAKTRTWFSVEDEPIVAWAGFCRNLPVVGPVYAGMTMPANAAIPPTNDRMPALLEREEYDAWLHADIKQVIHFMYRPPFAAERMKVERTDDRWRSGAAPPIPPPPLALL